MDVAITKLSEKQRCQAQQLHSKMGEWVSKINWDCLSQTAKDAARDVLVDYIGVAVAASREEVAHAALRVAAASSSGGRCSVIGSPNPLSAPLAAMVNATLGHAFDFDDVYLPGAAHYSTICIPAALALAEQYGASGKAVMAAIVAGNEAAGRIALATRSLTGGIGIRARGFFPTSAGGTIAGAAASASILNQDAAITAQALGLSMNFSSGLASIGHGDNNSKCLLAGHAAQSGVQAALYAQAGFTCQGNVMESPRGFLNAFAGGRFDADVLERKDHDPWIVESISYKRYPVEYVIHPLVELAIAARSYLGQDLLQIAEIEVSCYSGYALFEPASLKVAPPDGYAAVFSAPYCIARALSKEDTGHLTLSDFTEAYVSDSKTKAIASKVRFVPDPAYDRDFPARVGARMKITSIDGAELFVDSLEQPSGTPQRPLAHQQLVEKFNHNTRAWTRARRESVLAMLYHVDESADSKWIRSLR
jgi:2-methylcitrate dehydratase PrpD